MTHQLNRRAATRLIVGGVGSVAASFSHSSEGPGSAPFRYKRGFNLPNQAPAREEHVPRQSTLRRLYELGMTHVRLPVEAEFVTPAFCGPQTRDSAFSDLNKAIERLVGLGFHVSVDLQPGADLTLQFRDNPDRALAAVREGWRELGGQLKRWSAANISLELLNEPPVDEIVWRPFAENLATQLRGDFPAHTLIVGPARFQRMDALIHWTPLPDRNVVYACHYYDPMVFTHQGLTWEPENPLAHVEGVPFPFDRDDAVLLGLVDAAWRRGDEKAAHELRQAAARPANRATINAQFEETAKWSQAHAAPVIINEFGVLKWKAPRTARLAWLADVRKAAESYGFGWAHWEYAQAFGFMDENGDLDPGVMKALFG